MQGDSLTRLLSRWIKKILTADVRGMYHDFLYLNKSISRFRLNIINLKVI
jgi:hypothetical protein